MTLKGRSLYEKLFRKMLDVGNADSRLFIHSYVCVGGVQMNNKDTKVITFIFGILGTFSFFGLFFIVLAVESDYINDITALKMSVLCSATLFLSYKILEFTEEIISARERKKH